MAGLPAPLPGPFFLLFLADSGDIQTTWNGEKMVHRDTEEESVSDSVSDSGLRRQTNWT